MSTEMKAVVRLADRLQQDDFRNGLVVGQLRYRPLNWTALVQSYDFDYWRWLVYPLELVPDPAGQTREGFMTLLRERTQLLMEFDARLDPREAIPIVSSKPNEAFIPERAYFVHMLDEGLVVLRAPGDLERTFWSGVCDV
mmetsp:Transcript_22354/g.76573  ORF Transcript_22354/g.76573 Transcript_22354/m.76573 type:complete len:140 (-) Transcript_22354:425-844(-)